MTANPEQRIYISYDAKILRESRNPAILPITMDKKQAGLLKLDSGYRRKNLNSHRQNSLVLFILLIAQRIGEYIIGSCFELTRAAGLSPAISPVSGVLRQQYQQQQ